MRKNHVSLKLETNDLKIIATYLNKLQKLMVINGSINKVELSFCKSMFYALHTKFMILTKPKYTLKLLNYEALLLSEMLQRINPDNLYAKSLFLGIIGEVDKQTA